MTKSEVDYIAHMPYRTGDILFITDNFYMCMDTEACRLVSAAERTTTGVFLDAGDADNKSVPRTTDGAAW